MIGEESNSLRFKKPNQHKKEVSSQLSNHEICYTPEGACIAQNRLNIQEPMQTPNCSTSFMELVGADHNKWNTGEEWWELSSPGTLHQQEPQIHEAEEWDITGFPSQNNNEHEAKEIDSLDNPRQLNLYSFDTTDKEIFIMICQ